MHYTIKCAMIALTLSLIACRGSDKPAASEASAPASAASAAASGHLFQGQEDALNKAKSAASQMSKEGEDTAKAIEAATK